MATKITWRQVGEGIRKISEALEGVTIRTVYGVPRGGLILGGLLSHQIRCLELCSTFGSANFNGQIVVIDDIVDTGTTIRALRVRYPRAVFASLFLRTTCNPAGKIVFAFPAKPGDWLVFPWEREDEPHTTSSTRV